MTHYLKFSPSLHAHAKRYPHSTEKFQQVLTFCTLHGNATVCIISNVLGNVTGKVIGFGNCDKREYL